MPRLDWPDCENLRDVGGMPTAGGASIRTGALVRADSLTRLTPAGIDKLRAYGVNRVVDLRNAEEVASEPHPFAADPVYLFRPLINEEAERGYDPTADTSLAAVYRGSLRRNAVNIAAAVTVIADAPAGAVLVHCSAGKDRTGMIVALVLKVAGVPDEVVVADYAYSSVCLRPRLDSKLAAALDEDERAFIREWKDSVPATMWAMLRYLDDEFGGAEMYLRRHGITDDQIVALRDRLLVTPSVPRRRPA